MVLAEVLIPVADNDGAAFGADVFISFEAELVENFGGFSRLPGFVLGAWQDEGVIYQDELIVYQVALSSLLREGSKVVAVAESAKRRFRQEAIFVRYNGLAEVL